jgi:ubiquinone/menaquinone biosynthesis C-methylase UbiE
MSTSFGSGLHAAPGRAVDILAYDRYLGRRSRLFVPALIAAAEVSAGYRVLDVATGPGEAALMTLPGVDPSGVVIGADIWRAML